MSCPDNEATKLESKKDQECKENCEFNHEYNPNSSCVLTNKGNYLEIKTDGKNNVSYNNHNLSLEDVRFYTPSLHTFDGKHIDGELILKHHGNGINVWYLSLLKQNQVQEILQLFSLKLLHMFLPKKMNKHLLMYLTGP